MMEQQERSEGTQVDLSALERIEAELHGVERALEQIDQGVYDGFTGLDDVAIEPPEAD